MVKKVKPGKAEKTKTASNYIQKTKDADCLYYVVVMMGPCFFGSIMGTNSNTVWARIENPDNFRYYEMKALAEELNIPIDSFMERVKELIVHNNRELSDGRPIGRKKYRGY